MEQTLSIMVFSMNETEYWSLWSLNIEVIGYTYLRIYPRIYRSNINNQTTNTHTIYWKQLTLLTIKSDCYWINLYLFTLVVIKGTLAAVVIDFHSGFIWKVSVECRWNLANIVNWLPTTSPPNLVDFQVVIENGLFGMHDHRVGEISSTDFSIRFSLITIEP